MKRHIPLLVMGFTLVSGIAGAAIENNCCQSNEVYCQQLITLQGKRVSLALLGGTNVEGTLMATEPGLVILHTGVQPSDDLVPLYDGHGKIIESSKSDLYVNCSTILYAKVVTTH